MNTSTNRMLVIGSCIAFYLVSNLFGAACAAQLPQWKFDRNGDREGWAVPQRLTGVVMGGSLWLTPTPREQDPAKIASLVFQYGPGPGGSVEIVSPSNLKISVASYAGKQLQVQLRLLNLSPTTNLDVKWRMEKSDPKKWFSKRCSAISDLNRWQEVTCFIDQEWRGTIDQIALGISENVIRGDLWIDSIRIEWGGPEPVRVRPDLAGPHLVPKVSIPYISQAEFLDAFKVLDEGLVVDVPVNGFPYPFIKAAGDGQYGDFAWHLDSASSAAAAAWVNQSFAEDVMRGFHAVEAINPDGRISGYLWEPVLGQVGDVNVRPDMFFDSAYSIAMRARDPRFRALVYETMARFLEWYLSPIKRDEETQVITGAFEEILFPASPHEYEGAYTSTWKLRPRGAVSLNVAVAVGAALTSELAADLGRHDDAMRYRAAFVELKEAINTVFWDEKDGVYYDYDLESKKQLRYRSGAIFFPLRHAIAPEARRQRLVQRLTDPAQFNWGEFGVARVAKTEEAPLFLGESVQDVWAGTNVPIIKGLEESGYHALAAELNWATIKLFGGSYTERYTLNGVGRGSQRYGFTASAYIRGVIEHLFGVGYDAARQHVWIAPHVPRVLFGKEISLSNLILPSEGKTSLSVRIKQLSPTFMHIEVSVSGDLPKGQLHIELPGQSRRIDVPLQRSFKAVLCNEA